MLKATILDLLRHPYNFTHQKLLVKVTDKNTQNIGIHTAEIELWINRNYGKSPLIAVESYLGVHQ